MQFQTAASSIKQEKKLGGPSLLSLYYEPPQEELSLDEFEMLSLDRLQLLRGVELAKGKLLPETDLNQKVKDLEKKFMKDRKEFYGRLDEVKRDQISHFILRLAYCRTEDNRRWFLQQEVQLFKSRFESLLPLERERFMRENELEFEQVSNDEKASLHEQLLNVNIQEINRNNITQKQFFKIPFIQALPLIANRAVYLERGFAYVPFERLAQIIITRYRTHLSRALAEANASFGYVESDSRIAPLLYNLNKQYVGNDFSGKQQVMDKLTPDKVDLAAEVNMPLCMKNLHNNLKKEHKLKHWGRLQYGLFLKGAGLDLEGAQQFWESHFTKIMNHDQYVKSYSYSFRHMYGKEGARKNYTPYSCMKIIMGAPPEAGAFHGCPYRHMPDGQLASLLGSLKIAAPEVKNIVELAKSSNYQVACQRHFEITHPGFLNMDLKLTDTTVANHPNQWFQASVNYHKVKNGQVLGADPVLDPPSSDKMEVVSSTEISDSAFMEIEK